MARYSWLLPILFFLSCSGNKKTLAVLSAKNLPSFFATIHPHRDTVLHTPKGAEIRISSGTFSAPTELEVKEAYTPEEILLAGLVTESDDRLLKSGGMIFIDTKGGEGTINKPISISIPTHETEENMLVFRGEEGENGINWKEADSLNPPVLSPLALRGKALFYQNCRSCHATNQNLTGPVLAGVTKRGPWVKRENLYKWIRNPAAFIPTSAYTKSLQQQYNGQIMPGFPQLRPEEVDAILAFAEEAKNDKALVAEEEQAYASLLKRLQDSIPREEADSIEYNDAEPDTLGTAGLFVADTSFLSAPVTYDELQEGLRAGFTDSYYKFDIETLGWYNIDAYVRGEQGTVPSTLEVQLTGSFQEPMRVYLLVPGRKNLSVGQPQENGLFHFKKDEGKIPLFPGEEALVMAFSDGPGAFFYGMIRVQTAPAMSVTVPVTRGTEEEFLSRIKKANLSGLEFKKRGNL